MTHKSRDSIGINLIDLEDKPSVKIYRQYQKHRSCYKCSLQQIIKKFHELISTYVVFNLLN